VTSGLPETLSDAACRALATAEAVDKADAAKAMAAAWRAGALNEIGHTAPPDRPARPARPELRPPREMPKRGRGGSMRARVALLHALAHIELNAIDLACDLLARFPDENMPRGFHDDWVRVADEEAMHFILLAARLKDLGAAYGDLPAHDGLWEAAQDTRGDILARIAVVPLVLEARGLDVTPTMIASLRRAGDDASAAVLERIYDDEIGHVATGRRWFDWLCARRKLDPAETWQALVRRHFRGALKPPFNAPGREAAGLPEGFYAPLVTTSP
jgi:uncharacterized ferritin-like protein (DUF455 family)